MKRGYQRHFYHARTIKLYRDDIEEVIDVVTKYCKTVVIASDEYEYDSLDELESRRGSEPKQIEIKGSHPYIYFHTSRGLGGRSWVSGDGDGSESPYLLISTLLAQRKRKWLRLLFSLYTSAFFTLILTLLPIIFVLLFKPSIFTYIVLILPSFVLMVLMMWLSIATYLGNFSYITLRRQHEKSTFWTRNKDTVWVGIIVAAVTAFITWLITYLTTK